MDVDFDSVFACSVAFPVGGGTRIPVPETGNSEVEVDTGVLVLPSERRSCETMKSESVEIGGDGLRT